MEDELKRLEQEAASELDAISDPSDLEVFRVKYLGRKGQFSAVMRQLGQVSKEERPRLGQLANSVKKGIEELFEQKKAAISAPETTSK